MPHKDPKERYSYQKAYRESHRAKRAAQRPDQDRARHANRRAAIYGVEGRILTRDVRQVLAAGKCFYCESTDRLTIDHVVPLNAGGANDLSNLVACCLKCNISKYRSDLPGRWSQVADNCFDCGTTDRKHLSYGLCGRCYQRQRKSGTLAEHARSLFDLPDIALTLRKPASVNSYATRQDTPDVIAQRRAAALADVDAWERGQRDGHSTREGD